MIYHLLCKYLDALIDLLVFSSLIHDHFFFVSSFLLVNQVHNSVNWAPDIQFVLANMCSFLS